MHLYFEKRNTYQEKLYNILKKFSLDLKLVHNNWKAKHCDFLFVRFVNILETLKNNRNCIVKSINNRPCSERIFQRK